MGAGAPTAHGLLPVPTAYPNKKLQKKLNQLLFLGEASGPAYKKLTIRGLRYLFVIAFPQEAKLLDKCITSIDTT